MAIPERRSRGILFRFFAVLIAVAGIWASLELTSWAVLRSYVALTGGQRDAGAQAALVQRLGTPITHPLWAGFGRDRLADFQFEAAQLYDPVLGHRPAARSAIDQFRGTDRYGFIHNGDPERVIDFGPDTARIILLGGSSTAGTKASSNEQTIGGHLERQLNNSGDGRRYQVMNAGVAGFYSPLEAIYFMTELVHYRPSVIVVLDGKNDFWHSWSSTRNSADHDGRAIPNRNYKQQEYLAFFAGEKRGRPLATILREPSLLTRVFHYSGELSASILVKIFGEGQPIGVSEQVSMKKDPWGQNSEWLSQQVYGSPSHVPFMLANWRNMAGAASSQGIGAVFLLQPFIPVAGRTLTEVEKQRFNTFLEERPHLDPADYQRLAKAFYAEARQGVAALKKETANQPLVYVEDISAIMNDQPEPMFMDNVHYTDRANAVLADYMAGIIQQMMNAGDGSNAR